MARPPRQRAAAVIREQTRVAQTASNIGVVRASEGGVTIGNTLAREAGNLSNEFYKRAVPLAKQAGLDAAKAALPKDIMTINPETGAPEAFKAPGRLGSIASQSYQNLIERRFAESLEQEMRLKAKEYAFQSNGNAAQFTELMTHYVDSMGKNSTGKWAGYIHDAGVNLIKPTAANLALAQAKRERAAAAASAKASTSAAADSIREIAAAGGANALIAAGALRVKPEAIAPIHESGDFRANTARPPLTPQDKMFLDSRPDYSHLAPGLTGDPSNPNAASYEALRAGLVEATEVIAGEEKINQAMILGMTSNLGSELVSGRSKVNIRAMEQFKSAVDAGDLNMLPTDSEFRDFISVYNAVPYSDRVGKTFTNDVAELFGSYIELRKSNAELSRIFDLRNPESRDESQRIFNSLVEQVGLASALDTSYEELVKRRSRNNDLIEIAELNGNPYDTDEKAKLNETVENQTSILSNAILSEFIGDLPVGRDSAAYLTAINNFANDPDATTIDFTVQLPGYIRESFEKNLSMFLQLEQIDPSIRGELKTRASAARTNVTQGMDHLARTQRDIAENIVNDSINQIEAFPAAVARINTFKHLTKKERNDYIKILERPVRDARIAQLLQDRSLNDLRILKNIVGDTNVQKSYPNFWNQIQGIRQSYPLNDGNFPDTYSRIAGNNINVSEMAEAKRKEQMAIQSAFAQNTKDVPDNFEAVLLGIRSNETELVPNSPFSDPMIPQSFGPDVFTNQKFSDLYRNTPFGRNAISSETPPPSLQLDLNRLATGTSQFGAEETQTLLEWYQLIYFTGGDYGPIRKGSWHKLNEGVKSALETALQLAKVPDFSAVEFFANRSRDINEPNYFKVHAPRRMVALGGEADAEPTLKALEAQALEFVSSESPMNNFQNWGDKKLLATIAVELSRVPGIDVAEKLEEYIRLNGVTDPRLDGEREGLYEPVFGQKNSPLVETYSLTGGVSRFGNREVIFAAWDAALTPAIGPIHPGHTIKGYNADQSEASIVRYRLVNEGINANGEPFGVYIPMMLNKNTGIPEPITQNGNPVMFRTDSPAVQRAADSFSKRIRSVNETAVEISKVVGSEDFARFYSEYLKNYGPDPAISQVMDTGLFSNNIQKMLKKVTEAQNWQERQEALSIIEKAIEGYNDSEAMKLFPPKDVEEVSMQVNTENRRTFADLTWGDVGSAVGGLLVPQASASEASTATIATEEPAPLRQAAGTPLPEPLRQAAGTLLSAPLRQAAGTPLPEPLRQAAGTPLSAVAEKLVSDIVVGEKVVTEAASVALAAESKASDAEKSSLSEGMIDLSIAVNNASDFFFERDKKRIPLMINPIVDSIKPLYDWAGDTSNPHIGALTTKLPDLVGIADIKTVDEALSVVEFAIMDLAEIVESAAINSNAPRISDATDRAQKDLLHILETLRTRRTLLLNQQILGLDTNIRERN